MSTKAGAQQGRRTPLTLNAAKLQQQQQQLKPSAVQQNNAATPPIVKNDNKTANQKHEPTLAELRDAQRQANQEKKQSSAVDNAKKSQNGVAKVTKDKQQHQNGNDTNNGTEKKDKVEKIERSSKQNKEEKKDVVEELNIGEKKTQAQVEMKPEKDQKQQKKADTDAKDTEKKKQDKNVAEIVKQQPKKADTDVKDTEKPNQDKKVADTIVEHKRETTVATPKQVHEKKTATTNKKIVGAPVVSTISPSKTVGKQLATPTKVPAIVEIPPTPVKTPVKSTAKTQSQMISEDDVEMISLVDESSPNKKEFASVPYYNEAENVTPAATSTPGKVSALMSKIAAVAATRFDSKQNVPTPPVRTFSQISGRRSIRPNNDYTPSHFQSNMHFRESYRRINTELDVSSTSNTSLNVTVGSEVPNNSSFSFFGRGRKRDRTPPESISLYEVQVDAENSPPKRARMDVYGFFTAVASPLSLLRSRFSKASIQTSSTPVESASNLGSDEYETEVQNVSGILIEEEVMNADEEQIKDVADVVVGNEAGVDTPKKCSPIKGDSAVAVDGEVHSKIINEADIIENGENDDIKITETQLVGAVGDPLSKNKRCSVM